MPGYDQSRFIDLSESLVDHLKCSMCLAIYDTAMVADCGHSFCKDCIFDNLKNQLTKCPQCKAKFIKKRKHANKSKVVIGQFVFKHNLTANAIIDELKIKCDFESKGCPEVVKLGSLKAHLIECKHNYCPHCDLKQGDPVGHSCLALLKKDRMQRKIKQNRIKSLNEPLMTKNEQNRMYKDNLGRLILGGRTIASKAIEETNQTLSCKHLRVGTYQCQVQFVHLKSREITLDSLSLDSEHESILKNNMDIEFLEMQELIYCSDKKQPVIMIKPTTELCLRIKQVLNLWDRFGTISSNSFDVNSDGQSPCYITAMFYTRNEKEFEKLMSYLYEKSKEYQDVKFQAINFCQINELLTDYMQNLNIFQLRQENILK